MSRAPEWLENALVLGDGPSFHLVLCPARQEVDEWLTGLSSSLAQRRNASVRIDRLVPHSLQERVDEPLTQEHMIRAILEPLLQPTSENNAEGGICVLDASLMHPSEDTTWKWLFGRMNELRNRIMATLGGALLLVGPPRVELLFAKYAPDFWSIRSSEVSLPTKPRSEISIGITLPQLLRDLLQVSSWLVWDKSLSEHATALAAAQEGDLVVARKSVELLLAKIRPQRERWTEDLGLMLEMFLTIEEFSRVGWLKTAHRIQMHAQMLESLPSGMTDSDLYLGMMSRYFLLFLGEVAELAGSLDSARRWYDEALTRFYDYWYGGVMSGGESWLIRSALGCFRVRARLGGLASAQECLWEAEAFAARAPWLSLTDLKGVMPTVANYLGLATGYHLLGYTGRAAYFEALAQDVATPKEWVWEDKHTWAHDYQTWPPRYISRDRI